MTTKLQIDLARILGDKYPKGFHTPADIDIDTFLEFAEDDWGHELDLNALLAESFRVALVLDLDDVKRVRPDLNDEQSWDVLQNFRAAVQEWRNPLLEIITDLADQTYPSAADAKLRLGERLRTLLRQVEALPADERTNPAVYGGIAAKIDDVEEALRQNGGAQ